MPLFWRIFLLNALVLVAAAAVLLLAPVTISSTAVILDFVVVGAGLVAMLVLNLVLLRVGLAPLNRLERTMATVDLLQPTPRPLAGGHEGVAHLIQAFNRMIDRLEAERATSTARALRAQEDERTRVAQELHDEIGQTLTAVLLELGQISADAPAEIRDDLVRVQETTRGSLDEIRRIARRLRPGVLDELGLRSALRSLLTEMTRPAGLEPTIELGDDLPELSHDAELVVYRIAQEALTNTVRHAHASWVHLTLRRDGDDVLLVVRDDGAGVRGAVEGSGIRGMRERALLVGARLDVRSARAQGTVVELRVTP
jgi:two-component system, NarL family, sensor histidine kinase UhpB